MDRHMAGRLEDARMMALAAKPEVILIDRDLPRAEKLVVALREDPSTRRMSLVIFARGDFDPGEVAFLEAGANAILRLPAGPDWDERLTRLFHVPVRKEARFPVQFAVDATAGPGTVFPALALNLSLHGMLMESNLEVEVGQELTFLFHLPGSAQAAATRGVVMRKAAPTQYGIEFQKPAPELLVGIQTFLQTLPHA
jgi:hypothetical protein